MLISGFTSCKNSNDTTHETPEDMDDNRNNGDPNNQSNGYGTSNGYDDETDEIEHNHE